MTKRSATKLSAAALAAGALLAAVPAEGKAPCKPSCRDAIRVGARPVEWTSPASFPDQAPVEVVLKVGRRTLDSQLLRSCAANFYGRGVVAKVEGCDKPRSRIHIRAVNVDRKPVRLKIIVRAQ